MISDKQWADAFHGLWLASNEFNLQIARLGKPDGVGGYDVTVTDRPGWVYISKGGSGESGMAIAIDKVGVDTTAEWQVVKVRMEYGRLVIREAEYLAADASITTLAGLTDVQLTSLADGEGLAWNASASKWINVTLSGGGGAPSPHALSGVHHSGLLDWSLINFDSSNLADLDNRAHSSLSDVTADQHHNQHHAIVGSDHTATGLTTGHTIRATGATTFAWAQLQHNDLGGVTANQHHNQVHSIVGSDHTVTGSALDVIGLSATNTLAVLTPSSNPGATAKILRTASDGSLQLDTNLVYADAANNRVGINKTPGNAALDIVASSNSDHTQRIKQKSGQTGRLWRIENTDGDELIVLDSQGNLQSGHPGFVSGLTGWQITPQGNAEFNNIWARGELHATVFVKDEVHATGGTLLVATAGKLYSDAAIDATTVDTEGLQFEQGNGLEDWEIEQGSGAVPLQAQDIFNYIEIEDPPSGPAFYFDAGDIVRSKTEVTTGVTDFWLEIMHGIQLDGYSRYSVIKRSGTDGTLPAGSGVVSYGQPGDGRILITSDLNYAPYLDVFTVGPNVWSGDAGAIIPHVRLGRLDGLGLPGVSGIEQYGIAAATDASNANSPYIVASNLQLGLYRVDLKLNDGSNDTGQWTANGNLKIGTNIGTTNGTSFQVITTGGDAGDVIIGRLASNYLWWDQSAATLSINGTLQVGGSGVATVTYVDGEIYDVDVAAQGYADTARSSAISTAAGDATTKANAAQSAAQAYADIRRVVGVSGTWTSTDQDTISWSSVSIRLADGTTKSVSNGNTGNMTGQTWLYCDTSASAPLTLSSTLSIGSIPAGYAVIAVCNPGADKASVRVIPGTTLITGDNIVTGSIVASNIKAATITGDKIAAGEITAGHITTTTLAAIQVNTGALTVDNNISVGTTGAIRSGSKSYGSGAGFWLGYHSGAYKFDVGDGGSNRILFDGSSLQILTGAEINISKNAGGTVLTFSSSGGTSNVSWTYPTLSFTAAQVTGTGTLTFNKLVNAGDTMQISTQRTIPASLSTGQKGEFCFDSNYVYYCVTTNNWKRALLQSF